jgi:hypothetical protein
VSFGNEGLVNRRGLGSRHMSSQNSSGAIEEAFNIGHGSKGPPDARKASISNASQRVRRPDDIIEQVGHLTGVQSTHGHDRATPAQAPLRDTARISICPRRCAVCRAYVRDYSETTRHREKTKSMESTVATDFQISFTTKESLWDQLRLADYIYGW